MKLNRKKVTLGLVGLGLVGVLAGGVGVAAATGSPGAPTPSAAAGPFAGMAGMGTGMRGMAIGEHSPMSAAASYLGMSLIDLRTQLQAGKSLADVAKAHGKAVSGLEAAMVSAVTTKIDAHTTLTPAQKTAILALAKSRIDTMVNAIHGPGSQNGPMGGRMSGAMDDMMDEMGR